MSLVWHPSLQIHRVPLTKSFSHVLLSSSILTLELYSRDFAGQQVWNCFRVASDWKNPLQNRWGQGKREAVLLHKHLKMTVGWEIEENTCLPSSYPLLGLAGSQFVSRQNYRLATLICMNQYRCFSVLIFV